MAASPYFSASLLETPSSRRLATVLANVVALVVFAPAGIAGLAACWRAHVAERRGDLRGASAHAARASVIAETSLYGALSLYLTAAVVLLFVLR